jgi:hypothetical protein
MNALYIESLIFVLTAAGKALLRGVAITYLLWIFYLAVMNLKQAQDNGKLSILAYALGVPVLKVGLILDVIVNVLVMTVLLLELPKEWLVTTRLKRHNRAGKGWRYHFAQWCEQFLDPFDPSGDHI